jgi:hypothetical protein
MTLALLAGAGVAAYFLLAKSSDGAGASASSSRETQVTQIADAMAAAMSREAQRAGLTGTVQVSIVAYPVGDVNSSQWSAQVYNSGSDDAITKKWVDCLIIAETDVRAKFPTVAPGAYIHLVRNVRPAATATAGIGWLA